MILQPLKTEVVSLQSDTIENILVRALPDKLTEKSILAISSKIIALCQGRVANPKEVEKETLLQQEAELFLAPEERRGASCTVVHNAFIGAAGIDESNADGHYVLLPENPLEEAKCIQNFLQTRYQIQNVGVIITDSRSTPLRRGASGVSLGYAGFRGLKDYRGTEDIFGRTLQLEVANHVDALAATAVVAMGEGSEQTPLILMENLPGHIVFEKDAPSNEELSMLYVPLEDDIFSPIIHIEKLKRGGKYKK